ncbi:type ISP restriction/modification enzyme [Bacillus subtilis]|uniref:type ISP restriction/modification enzyme n=2 Tax=Bacillus subtilis TaxID=1423 RepID=UPI00398E4251
MPSDLKKALPRIPILKKDKYVESGRKLAGLHLNYETVEVFSEVVIEGKTNPSFKVTNMKHPKKGVLDKNVLNMDITITNIREKTYEYVVNDRPAIQWIMTSIK